MPAIFPIYFDILGHRPFDEKAFKENRVVLFGKLRYLEDYLKNNTYLAGESFSCADYVYAVWLAPLFYAVLDENFRKGHPSLVRHYKHVLANKVVKRYLRAPWMTKNDWFGVKADKGGDKPA